MSKSRRCFLVAAVLFCFLCLLGSASLAQDVIQSQDTNFPDVTAHLRGLKSRQDVLTLKFRSKNEGKDNQRIGFLIQDSYLIDVANKKKYFPLKDADGNYLAGPLHSKERGGKYESWLRKGASANFWIKFPVPVGNPETISVVIPGVLPFEHVPLKK